MRFKVRGRTFNILLKKHIIPVGIEEVIPRLIGTPKEYGLIVNGDRLKGKVALVTGAHKGIGYQIALRLLKDGAKVIITGRNENKLRDTVARLKTRNLSYMVWDVADGKNAEHLDEACRLFGKIDILVNNAGVNKIQGESMRFENATSDYIHKMNDINVVGVTDICEAFVEKYSKGTILNILSNTAVRSATGIYWMSKWAIYSYTIGLGNKLKDSSITVNGLCPGPTKTDMMFSASSSLYSPSMANKRMAMPEEIAEMAFLQILQGLNGKNGEILVCDGGESLI